MIMNKIFNKIGRCVFVLGIMMAAVATFTACSSNDDPFYTVSENDYPRILNTDIPEYTNGDWGFLPQIPANMNFEFPVIVTPKHYTEVTWYIDGELVYTGDTINQPVLAGNHVVKIIATNKVNGMTSERTCNLIVTPLEGDPQMGTNPDELFVFPNKESKVSGCQNIANVAKMYIGGKEVSNFSVNGDEITFTTPSDLTTGTYRVVFEDAAGKKYGGNAITVVSSALVRANSLRISSGNPVTITGYNLDQVQSVKVGDAEATITAQTTTSLTFSCESEIGEKSVTITDKSGKTVKFFNNSKLVDELVDHINATVVKEVTAWEGEPVNIDWNVFDNCNQIMQQKAVAGMKLIIYYTINASDYHQIRLMGNWDNLFPEYPNDVHIDGNIGDSGKIEIELSTADVKIIKDFGFWISGHGVKILRVAYQ